MATGTASTSAAGAATGAAPLLELRGLSTEIRLKHAVVRAVDHVDLTLSAGETLGLVGESGSGKTMTAMSIERLLPPGGRITGGRILFGGVDLVGLPEAELRRIRGAEIGLISQNPTISLNPVVPVGVQVAEALLLHTGASKREARDRVVEMFASVGIPNPARRYDDYPHQLSGGQQQRVMIAMALICRPKLLIADEPTTALDVTIQKQILELIDRLREELGMAVILVTHDLGVIAGHTDRVAVMYAGRVVELAATEALFTAPRHRYTEALLEALPERAAGRTHRLYTIPGLPPDLTEASPGCRFAPRCRFATDACRDQDPPTVRLDGLAHEYACFHPREESGPPTEDLPPAPAAEARTQEGAESGDPGNGGAARVSDRSWVAPTTPIPEDGTPLLEIKQVVRDFPVTGGAILKRKTGEVSAVAGVSLRVERGMTLGLAGESGCGKTTLGRLVVGLERATSGEILFRGRRIDRMRGKEGRLERRHIQLMFQDSYGSLDPRMRVRAILREPLEIQRVGTSRDRDRRVDELLDAVGLPRRAAERYPHEFSGGQRQRIGLARALALQPALIVADEPVSALDVSIQAQVLNLMRALQRERELTYLFISHDLAVVRYLSDVIAVMYLGKVVEVGPAEDVYTTPRHHYTRALLDTIPVADPAVERAKRRLGAPGEPPSPTDPPSGCRFRTRCPVAQDVCATLEPPLSPVAGGAEAGPPAPPGGRTHHVACHFPLVAPASRVGAPTKGEHTPA
ncbi:ABC transporter ATP-binding protein [Sphaerisporangium krabiense]|uniref:Peptide/nickel transport system ATP-binding protein n=1 Tax=Sphaerisporangium krabiense TaxID=763782 RepID=A0A7W8Z563_9ACTN|nr:ABC transporter ATP-binding protein [Sphaerisporangium krabiense]MBB5627590.1 peptide/nickel transport system ATP-binding protein [Sphaerisporangium krabiense]